MRKNRRAAWRRSSQDRSMRQSVYRESRIPADRLSKSASGDGVRMKRPPPSVCFWAHELPLFRVGACAVRNPSIARFRRRFRARAWSPLSRDPRSYLQIALGAHCRSARCRKWLWHVPHIETHAPHIHISFPNRQLSVYRIPIENAELPCPTFQMGTSMAATGKNRDLRASKPRR